MQEAYLSRSSGKGTTYHVAPVPELYTYKEGHMSCDCHTWPILETYFTKLGYRDTYVVLKGKKDNLKILFALILEIGVLATDIQFGFLNVHILA